MLIKEIDLLKASKINDKNDLILNCKESEWEFLNLQFKI